MGDGWRLPTKDELNILYKNQKSIGGFDKFNAYWSSDENNDPDTIHGKQGIAWSQTFYSGIQTELGKSSYRCLVRLVKSI